MRTTWLIPAASLAALCLPGCGGPRECEGLLKLETEADVADAQPCTSATALGIEGTGLTKISLPNLKTLERDLGVTDNIKLLELTLPALESVGGTVHVRGNTLLTTLSLPRLREAGRIELLNDPSITSLDLPSLAQTKTGPVSLSQLGALSSLSLPEVTTLALGLELDRNDELLSVSLPKLTEIASSESGIKLSVHDNPRFTTLDVPQLVKVAGPVSFERNTRLKAVALPAVTSVGGLGLYTNPALTTFSAPQLASSSGQVEIASNGLLTTLGLGALKTAQCLYIHDNPSLADCDVKTLTTQVTDTCSTTSGNNKGDGCP